MLTVFIATRDGAETLPEVLEALLAAEPVDGGWRLVVADNRSTDGTRRLVEAYADRLPLTYVFEPRGGKNAALNTALSHLDGDLAVFMDDDIVPEPQWLRVLRDAADARPETTIFGGPILPRWAIPPPEWLLDYVPMDATYAILDSCAEGPVPPLRVFGGNLAIRAEVFRGGARFDETIGPKGSNYAMAGESVLLAHLSATGHTAWHCEAAVVRHLILAHQMTRRWALARAVRFGRGKYRLRSADVPNGDSASLGVPHSLSQELATQCVRTLRAKLAGDPKELFKTRWRLNYLAGQIYEALRQTGARRRAKTKDSTRSDSDGLDPER